MRFYNIYCDESCHLEKDRFKAMSFGAIWCDKQAIRPVSEKIRQLKVEYGLSRQFEIKWTKVSSAKLEFYRAIINLFFQTPELYFRGVIVPDKSLLHHDEFRQTHNEFYYKILFTLLKIIFNPIHQYAIYLDIKDTRSQEMVEGLHNCLCNSYFDFNRNNIRRVQQIRSHESELLQVTDILVGALSYLYRGLQTSQAKQALIQQIKQLSGYSLERNTLYKEEKFNLLVWKAQDLD